MGVRAAAVFSTALMVAPLAAWAQDAGLPSMVLEPGDAIRLEFLDKPELQGEFGVGYDGLVLLPQLGFVTVEGRPFSEVEDEIRRGYTRGQEELVFRVTPLVRVLVLGQVRQPGIFMVDPAHGMMDVLSRAGGLSSSADRGKITLVREGEVIARLDPESRRLGTQLHSGDRVVVGRVGWLRENVAVFIGALGSIAAAAVAGLIIR